MIETRAGLPWPAISASLRSMRKAASKNRFLYFGHKLNLCQIWRAKMARIKIVIRPASVIALPLASAPVSTEVVNMQIETIVMQDCVTRNRNAASVKTNGIVAFGQLQFLCNRAEERQRAFLPSQFSLLVVAGRLGKRNKRRDIHEARIVTQNRLNYNRVITSFCEARPLPRHPSLNVAWI